MKASERLHASVIKILQESIREAHGQEVMAVGKADGRGLVAQLAVVSRGSKEAVPAIAYAMEKGDMVIHNHPSGKLFPSHPDLRIASNLGNQGIGFSIIDNGVENIYVVAEPILLKERRELGIDALVSVLLPGGALSKIMPHYEARDSQVGFLEQVAHAFNQESVCLAEAGTGVGKSFAYLIPALRWTEENSGRIVVSTATINLQQQLLEKDIPLVKKLLNNRSKVVLVKGRGNYLCRNRLQEAVEEPTLFQDVQEKLKAVMEWSQTTATGSKSDLPFVLHSQVWAQVASEADSCLGLRCSLRENCFVLRARKEAASAQLLVVNHHLLFADLSMRLAGVGFETTAVLPPFDKIIFDEAHNIEKSATSFFSQTMNRFSVFKQVQKIFRRKGKIRLGLAISLERLVGRGDSFARIPAVIDGIGEKYKALEIVTLNVVGEKHSFRIHEPSAQVAEILDAMQSFHEELLDLIHVLQEIQSAVKEEDEENIAVLELQLVRKRLAMEAAKCESFLRWEEHKEMIYWVEKRKTSGGEQFWSYIITPLDISSVMREAVFEPYDTVICTSATLTVRDSFSFFKQRVGLLDCAARSISEGLFPSPFPYKTNVLLGVPVDFPQPGEATYLDQTAVFIKKVLEISEGRGLVLFTSFDMLRKTYDAVREELKGLGITVFKQGEEDRTKLLNKFKEDAASVLFGTDSFWEGVDVPGDPLKVVIICRLPFRVPTEPVVKARMEYIEQQGGNAFMDLSLPEAVTRFKQGFGRLIRSQQDHGVVLVLDSRIISKAYGKVLLASLPETRRSIKPQSSLLADVENFLYA